MQSFLLNCFDEGKMNSCSIHLNSQRYLKRTFLGHRIIQLIIQCYVIMVAIYIIEMHRLIFQDRNKFTKFNKIIYFVVLNALILNGNKKSLIFRVISTKKT